MKHARRSETQSLRSGAGFRAAADGRVSSLSENPAPLGTPLGLDRHLSYPVEFVTKSSQKSLLRGTDASAVLSASFSTSHRAG
jgi:hypothetical protein